MSTPQSLIYICSGVRLDNRYEHTIFFENKTKQDMYFLEKVVKTYRAYTYLRKSWPLQVEATMEEARTWSYLFFQNGGTGKIYYYFITQVEYKNENMVELTLELDVLQSYLFDFTLQPCFVERQHTPDDARGDYVLDEGLDCGELWDCGTYDYTAIQNLCIMVLATINPNNATTTRPTPALANMYNNVFSGLKVWAVPKAKWQAWGNQLEALSEAGFLDGIVSMWMYPQALVELGGEATWADDDICKPVASFPDGGIGINAPTDDTPFQGYVPKNNKLYTFPYNFLYVTNNAGNSAIYRYERFTNPNAPTFNLYGTVSPDGGVILAPRKYNGVEVNFDNRLVLGNYPTCAWDSDTYKMWLAQNQNQLNVAGLEGAVKVVAGIGAGVAGALTGNVAGGMGGVVSAMSGVSQIAGLVAQNKDMQVQPPQSRGAFSATANITAGKQTFSFYHKCLTSSAAKIIDGYLTMYGYKLNSLRTPSINARPAFTYVKTIGCKVVANLCSEDVTKIEAIFDRGITWWKNGDKICDYSQDNSV